MLKKEKEMVTSSQQQTLQIQKNFLLCCYYFGRKIVIRLCENVNKQNSSRPSFHLWLTRSFKLGWFFRVKRFYCWKKGHPGWQLKHQKCLLSFVKMTLGCQLFEKLDSNLIRSYLTMFEFDHHGGGGSARGWIFEATTSPTTKFQNVASSHVRNHLFYRISFFGLNTYTI